MFYQLLSVMNANAQYRYFDGSGNEFIVAPTSLQYVPISPKNSSSGTYSGGEEKLVQITKDNFDAIVKLLDKAIENPSIHQEAREMMTGMIIKDKDGNAKKVVIKASSDEKKKIEELLRSLLK